MLKHYLITFLISMVPLIELRGALPYALANGIPTLPAWEGDRIFLRLIAEDAPFFSLKLTYHGETLTSAVLNGKEVL